MKVRVITSLIGSILIICMLMFANTWSYIVDIVFALAIALGVGEALNAEGLLKKYPLSIPCLAFGFLMPFFITGQYMRIFVAVFCLAVFCGLIFDSKKISFKDVTFAFTTTVVISTGLSSIIMLYAPDRVHTIFYTVIALSMPWFADSGAYFAGVLFGKHKLCPTISPKKTIEGAIGGIISAPLFMLLEGVVFKFIVFPNCGWTIEINFMNMAIYGFVCSFISIIGDLSFSLLKRSCNIKDYGSILPGHGGLLDRVDSVIFTAPALLVLYPFIPMLIV